MKIFNFKWRKKLAASMLAAGMWVPSAAYAVDIPLPDPSFEAFVVPSGYYAYSDTYRPTSAWVDDQDNPPNSYPVGASQDVPTSQWMYDAAYVQGNQSYPYPRTGNQVMHTIINPNYGVGGIYSRYSTQELPGTLFEAGKVYTFSIYAQGDVQNDGDNNEVSLYIFDGSKLFSEANSLKFQKFTSTNGDYLDRVRTRPAFGDYNDDDITEAADYVMWRKYEGTEAELPNDGGIGGVIGQDHYNFWLANFGRVPTIADTDEQSQAKWTQISISHTVLAGAPEIGNPVGVGFGGGISDDTAIDDASLDVSPVVGSTAGQSVVPEPSSLLLMACGLPLLAWRRRE